MKRKEETSISMQEWSYLRKYDVGREMLKWGAILSMTIDHIGKILYSEHLVLQVIGRLAFPIFCYLIILGAESTRSIRKYFARLFLFALISQVPYHIAFEVGPFDSLNPLFTLSLGVVLIYNPLLTIFILLVPFFLNFDFWLYGFAWIICLMVVKKDVRFGVILCVLLNLTSLLISKIQIFSLIALPIILFHNKGSLKIEREVNGNFFYPAWRKYFFYAYYPLHLTLLYLIKINLF